MLRMIGTKIIIPKGDTGSFSVPKQEEDDREVLAKFIVQDPLTLNIVIEKEIFLDENCFIVEIERSDTVSLVAKKYFWDIKTYFNPIFDDDNILIDAEEINSYYSAFNHPQFIIKEVAKDV